MKFQSKFIYFQSRKSIRKCHLENGGHLSRPQCVKWRGSAVFILRKLFYQFPKIYISQGQWVSPFLEDRIFSAEDFTPSQNKMPYHQPVKCPLCCWCGCWCRASSAVISLLLPRGPVSTSEGSTGRVNKADGHTQIPGWEACHPGGHYWDYYTGILSLSEVNATYLKMGYQWMKSTEINWVAGTWTRQILLAYGNGLLNWSRLSKADTHKSLIDRGWAKQILVSRRVHHWFI